VRINTKNKSTYEERRSGINTGWCVTLCNNLNDHLEKDTFDGIVAGRLQDLNFEWYIKETEKLVYLLKGESDGREGE